MRASASKPRPNARLALVEREKIVDYLLNPAHRQGARQMDGGQIAPRLITAYPLGA